MSTRDETLAVVLSIAVALLMVVLAVIVGASAGPASTQGGPPGPACAEWTDSCVVCRRMPEGLACSTPGIACVPGAQRCLRR